MKTESDKGLGPRKRGGGLSRSETVTIRLDPKLNYLSDLAARIQRRTKSSFVESVVADRVDRQPLTPRNSDGVTIGDKAEDLWHVRDYERLIRLAEHAPHLMTFDEQQIWAVICDCGLLWRGRWRDRWDGTQEWSWTTDARDIRRDEVANHWNTLVKIADGTLGPSQMPRWIKTRPKPNSDMDDEIPF